MNSAHRKLVRGLVPVLALVVLGGSLGILSGDSSSAPRKENLDLPFDAYGVEEDEPEAPEVIFFYGGEYEADAIVFCVDESLSMRKNSRWQIQKREITQAIMQLTPKAKFGLVFYGSGAFPFRPTVVQATQSNKMSAIAFLHNRQLSLGTCLGPGVVKSLEMLRRVEGSSRSVIVAGDGRPTVCPFVRGQGGASPQQAAAILQETLAANPGRDIRVHTIFVGTDQNPGATEFMQKLASLHNGSYRASSR